MKLLLVSSLLILAAACQRPCQRFIPAPSSGPGVLVDTETGRLCDGTPTHSFNELPLCYDLYKQSK